MKTHLIALALAASMTLTTLSVVVPAEADTRPVAAHSLNGLTVTDLAPIVVHPDAQDLASN